MIPVMRPKLPAAHHLAPYLVAIDESRTYSNFGPLTCAFEDRLGAHFGLQSGMLTTVANATLGLALALRAQGARTGTLCAIPGWTFVASANAAVIAGLIPYFIDVSAATWAIDPRVVEDVISSAPATVGAVMAVAPFGRPINFRGWDTVKARTGLPVVIDAAAAFDSLHVCNTPVVVSLHATKILGVGEGGFVASRDPSIVRAVRQQSNFGFDGSRNCVVPGLNAKLSEYHAAVGLAALDVWSEQRRAWVSVASAYRRALANTKSIHLQPGFGERWVSSTCVLSVDEHVHARTQEEMAAAGIETRRWWGTGAHNQPAMAAFPRAGLSVTESLAGATIGVPFYPDLTENDVQHIAQSLIAA
jgi:dTDP-4-amino-4,6-dideoxygalactose transaminase